MSSKDLKSVGPWRVKAQIRIFDNPWISVEDHQVIHPDGTPGEYGVVRFKNKAIGVLPIDQNGNVWLVGQHRFPSDKYSWELPEGGGPLKDDPLKAAKRELLEETGLKARCWEEFAAFDISNSVTDEKAICYFAWDLEEGVAAPDSSEALTLKRIPFQTLLDMVMKGEISDSLTIVMVLSAYVKALRKEAPGPISHLLLDGPEQT